MLHCKGCCAMKRYKLIVRGKIIMPWKPTDEDLKIMDCFYESPAFCVDAKTDVCDILDFACDRYSADYQRIRIPDTFELVPVG